MSSKLPRHLSASSIGLYLRCPNCWAQRYVEGDKSGLSSPLFFGRVISLGLEALHLGNDPRPIVEKAHRQFAEIMAKHGMGELRPSAAWAVALLQKYATDYFHSRGAPERKFKLTVPGVPVPLIGYLDLETSKNCKLGKCVAGIEEYKTTTKMGSWNQKRVDQDIQLTTYWAQHLQRHGRQPDYLRLIAMSQAERDSGLVLPEDMVEFQTTRNRGDIESFHDLVNEVWDGIASEDFPRQCAKCRRDDTSGWDFSLD